MSLGTVILTILKISIALSVFALGLKTTVRDVTYLYRNPREIGRSFLSMYVFMPLVAIVLALAFDLHPAVKVALVALAVSPIPPLLPRRVLKAGGDSPYMIGLLFLAASFSIVFVPVVMKLLESIFGLPSSMSQMKILLVVLVTVIIPLVAGIVVRHWAQGFAERAAKPVSIVATVMLIASTLPILFTVGPALWSLVGNGTLVAIAAFVIAGLLVGHFLGGPQFENRTVLAFSTASRHPGVAMTIAVTNFSEQKLAPAAVLLYLLVGAIVTIPYQLWTKRRTSGNAAQINAVTTRQ